MGIFLRMLQDLLTKTHLISVGYEFVLHIVTWPCFLIKMLLFKYVNDVGKQSSFALFIYIHARGLALFKAYYLYPSKVKVTKLFKCLVWFY